MILDSISKPSDIKFLSQNQLETLCSELRSEIVRLVSKNGGHLGSNLGAIELIVAIYYVFDLETDRLLFDVGHQAYAHKLLSGRRNLMENLRKNGGASGFPDPLESKYDHFIAGHASNSLSAALGIAKARDLKHEDFKVLSILGDGSLSGGMIYEAMNNISKTPNFIVILNDNQMSISKSVGSMSNYLSRLLATRGGLSFRKVFSSLLSSFPSKFSSKIENFIKNVISAIRGGNIFEELGFQYVGPIDGHNLKNLIKILQNIRDIANYKPVLIHTITKKGKGYFPAENDNTNLHGVDKSKGERYSDIFGKKIIELAEKDEKIVCITAAMKNGTGLNKFAKKFPDRFFDVGIAEEHAVTFAAGLAKEGLKPYVCIYSTFLQRAFDQIFHDVVLQNLPVRFIIDKSGFPGNDGKTHAGIYDISMLQNFPNFIIMAPSSKFELEKMLEFSVNQTQPLSIRFPKTEVSNFSPNCEFSKKLKIINEGTDHLIILFGDGINIVNEAMEVSKTNPTIIDARFIQPFDFERFYEYALKHNKIIIIEEGVFGGCSNVILEQLLRDKKFDLIRKIQFLNINKSSINHMSRTEQLNLSPISASNLAKILKSSIDLDK